MSVGKEKINVLSLFDGISCGQIALEKVGIGVENYFASEIDKYAMQVTKYNYPNTKHIGDVTKVKGADLPKIDLLIGGSPCFPKGQRVITINGFKNIEDIKKGDMVLTHKGRYREVATPMERLYDGKLYKIRPTYYNFTIDTTNEHPFFTQRGWVNAEDLKEDDYLSMPLNKEMINPQQITYKQVINQHKEIYKTTNLPILNENFWKLIGYWLAEGWTRDKRNGKNSRNIYRIFLSVTEHKMKFIQPVIEALGIHYRIEKSITCDKISFGSKDYWLFIKQFTNGNRSTNKLIPEFVQNMPKHLIRAFVEGYKNGDGSENDEKIRYSSTSKILLEGLQRLLLKTENKLYSLSQTHYERQSIIDGRVVNAKDSYSLEKNKTDNKFAYFTEDYVFYKVRTITTEDVNLLTVHNFEVEEDNSYCLPITAVHNCQGFSIAGKKLNFDDDRSKLFFEFVRLKNELNPKYFLLENVRMRDDIADAIDELLGVKRIYIDSRNFTGMIRKRYYWTNIPIGEIPTKNVSIEDLLDNEPFDRDLNFFLDRTKYEPTTSYDGIITINPRDNNGKQTWQRGRVYDIKGSCPTICASLFDLNITKDHKTWRKLTINECEKLQGVPKDYTSIVSKNERGKQLGNGWNVDTVAFIFSFLSGG